MDKVQSFAKVIIGVMAISFSILALTIAVVPLSMVISRFSVQTVLLALACVVLSGSLIALLLFFGVVRPHYAFRLVARPLGLESASVPWLPVAYRLVCLLAGLYCWYRVISRITGVLATYFYFRAQATSPVSLLSFRETVPLVLLMGLGLYLLAGAPHFVRWHLKATMKFCRDTGIGPEATDRTID